MRKITLLSLSLLMAGIAMAGNVTGKLGERIKRMNAPGRSLVSVPGMNDRSTKATQMKRTGMWTAPSVVPVRKAATTDQSGDEAAGKISDVSLYGMIYGPEGDSWFYTKQYTDNDTAQYYYSASDIVIYNSSHEVVGNIHWTCPEGKKVNEVEPYGQVTKKMFDNNDKTQEVAVAVHYIVKPGYAIDSTYIYTLDGEIVRKYEGQVVDVVDIRQDEWKSYQRAIVERLSGNIYEEDVTVYFDVLKPMGWGDTEPTVEHTFEVKFDLTLYSDGPCFSICDVDGDPYYVLSHYKDTYVEGYDLETLEMIVRENNEYVLDVYDKDYKQVDSFGVKLDVPEGALYRMAGFSMFSENDMSRNYFTDNGKLNYVITYYDYVTSSDEFIYTFQVLDGEGNLQKTICDNATEAAWFRLSELRGHDTQWAFLQTVGSTQQVQMVNLPSCEKDIVIPATLDGENISLTLDRYPKGDTYQYAINLAQGDVDNAGNVIARIAWYNRDLTLDHYTKFNLGPNAEYFAPMLTDEALNPYTFDTDDEHEYIFLAKIKRDNSTVIDNVIIVCNEDGSVLREFRGDDEYSLSDGTFINTGLDNYELCVISSSSAYPTTYNIEMFPLPFVKFAEGGSGSANDPYLVATLGDLQQIKSDTEAHYRLVNDIDMAGYPTAWTTIGNFTGTLDGDSHALSNFVISSDESAAGLFGMLGNGSQVKNLMVINPELELNGNNSYVGIIAGQAMGDSISNVHIYNASIKGDSIGATVGGIVGQPTVYSEIAGSSFEGVISVPLAEAVGGIAGDTRTSTDVVACSVKGTLTGSTQVGGIVGTTSTDSEVLDCRADVALKGDNYVGGIVGYNSARAAVSRCQVSGTIEATKASRWDGLATGGIVGYLMPTWGSSTAAVVNGNVMGADIIISAEDGIDETVNAIVGYTIANADDSDETESGLADNYVLSTVKVDGEAVTSDDATSTAGASKAKDELTTDFLKGIGYVYGTTKAEPWKEASALPVLWFENAPMALLFNPSSVDIAEGEKAEVTVTIYGTDASEIELKSSDESVATFEITAETDNSLTITIECKANGWAAITATAGDVTAECIVNKAIAGIAAVDAAADDLTIRLAAGSIEAAGASRITLYNAAGQLAARANGSSVSTVGMTKGIYIVVATDGKGRTVTGKVVVK